VRHVDDQLAALLVGTLGLLGRLHRHLARLAQLLGEVALPEHQPREAPGDDRQPVQQVQRDQGDAEADGVAVGSALLRVLLDGGGPEGAARFVGRLRSALDAT